MNFKRIMGVGFAIAMVAPVGVLSAQPAGAAALVTCSPPAGSVTFTPGLGTTPKIQTTSFKLPVKGCKGGGVTGGSSVGSAKGTTKQNCATFAKAGKTVTNVTITWNTKKTSTAALTTVVSASGSSLVATVTGKVSKGLFVGKAVKTKVKVTLQKGAICTDAHPLKTATLTGLAPFTIG
jgi:hypothetical protein